MDYSHWNMESHPLRATLPLLLFLGHSLLTTAGSVLVAPGGPSSALSVQWSLSLEEFQPAYVMGSEENAPQSSAVLWPVFQCGPDIQGCSGVPKVDTDPRSPLNLSLTLAEQQKTVTFSST